MRLFECAFDIPAQSASHQLLACLDAEVAKRIPPNTQPVRFVITSSSATYRCEVGVLDWEGAADIRPVAPIFSFRKRRVRSETAFNAVMIVPTGIGAETGGHAGDANRVVRLLAGVCDQLITHPNAVNAADINELPTNGLYVEGSVLSRLLMGTVGLQTVRSNRVLVIADDLRHDPRQPGNRLFTEATINAVSAARATLGLACPHLILMDSPIDMATDFAASGRAAGTVGQLERLFSTLDEFRAECDAVALSTVVRMSDEVFDAYYAGSIVNPWGGVEAMLTHAIATAYNLPAAHSPMLDSVERMNADLGIVDPRMAAEAVSLAALHCILKGLHKSPRIVELAGESSTEGLITASDISCLITPDGCLGLPHLAALEQGIPVIAVCNQQMTMRNDLAALPFEQLYFAENYVEAAGILVAIREGIDPSSLKNPLSVLGDFHETPQPKDGPAAYQMK